MTITRTLTIWGTLLTMSGAPACSGGDDDTTTSPGGAGGTTTTGGTGGTSGGGTSSGGTTTSVGGTTGSIGAGTSGAAASEPSRSAGESLSDAQLLQVAVSAAMGEASAGQLAVERTHSSAVGDFARAMVQENAGAGELGATLSELQGLLPAGSDESALLQAQARSVTDTLRGVPDAAFDRTYVDYEIITHEQLLVLVDQVLAPQAVDADVRAYLDSLRRSVQAQLEQVRTLDDAL